VVLMREVPDSDFTAANSMLAHQTAAELRRQMAKMIVPRVCGNIVFHLSSQYTRTKHLDLLVVVQHGVCLTSRWLRVHAASALCLSTCQQAVEAFVRSCGWCTWAMQTLPHDMLII
jgi:hypothetical protein